MAAMDFPQHSQLVLEQLNQQRQLGLLCDCTFVVDGINFKAHKAVLAACSEYFKMLFVDQKDVVHLDISNAAGLGQVLEFMYTAKLSLSPDNVEDVLAVAGFLQMQDIVSACNALKSLPVETCSTSEKLEPPEPEGEEKKAEEEKKAAAATLSELDRVEYGPLARPSEETSGEPEPQAESGGDGLGAEGKGDVQSGELLPMETSPSSVGPALEVLLSQRTQQGRDEPFLHAVVDSLRHLFLLGSPHCTPAGSGPTSSLKMQTFVKDLLWARH
uniref:Zinc finger and BTB domain containing 17 n=1 Tax=Vombatus ursinus TaxID=29139 RepID=A0A4X2JTK1_VOMUR